VTTETYEFYVVEYTYDDEAVKEAKEVFEEDLAEVQYESDPSWDNQSADDLSNAKRYTKLGAERKVKKERQMFSSHVKIRARKVKAIYEFIEEEK
jgi:hypothetical protein